MQTWLVHMRSPRTLLRELGLPGFAAFHLLVGGTVLASIVHGIFAATLVKQIWSGSEGVTTFFSLYGLALVVGYGVSAVIGFVGLARRRLLSSAWILLLIPVYWLLLSLAAWRALFQLVHDPYRWEKTEHGVARTSRLAQKRIGSSADR